MDIVSIRNEHMKYRCYFINTMCCMSLYNWYNYSLFDPIVNGFFTPYFQTCLLFFIYLCWDTYHMSLSNKKTILFRTDLIIHHMVCFFILYNTIGINDLQMNNFIIAECISSMNYIWRNNPKLLKIYRTLCILLVRMPMTFWFWLYYNPKFLLPLLKVTLGHSQYVFYSTLDNMYSFFIVYDMFILWKIYKPKSIGVN